MSIRDEELPLEADDDAPASPATQRKRTRLNLRIRETVALFLLCLAGIVAAAATVYGFGASEYGWRGMDVEVRLVPSLSGETRFVFAPLGEVRAATHSTPLTLVISLEGVSFDELKRFLKSPPTRAQLEDDFRAMSRRALTDFAARQILLAMAGALVVPLVLRLKKARFYTVPPLAAGAFVAIVFFHAAASFDPRALASPTYTGSLQQANWIIGLVKDGFSKADVLSDRLKRVAGSLNTLYSRIQSIPGVGDEEDTIKVLHISDIHNNPAAVDFVRELADKMRVDVVIDTGDLTDLGLPIESHLTQGLASLKMPYLFVAGNHDSLATVNRLRANPNAVILHDEPVTVAGLKFLGSPDPSSARLGAGSVDTSDSLLQAASDLLLERYRNAAEPLDLVCVHNPKQAASVLGVAPIVLCGHMHEASIEIVNGTVICNAGTTGGAGVRYFERQSGVPLTAAILSFSRTERPKLLFIDCISLSGDLGEYSLSRRSFESIGQPAEGRPATETGSEAPSD